MSVRVHVSDVGGVFRLSESILKFLESEKRPVVVEWGTPEVMGGPVPPSGPILHTGPILHKSVLRPTSAQEINLKVVGPGYHLDVGINDASAFMDILRGCVAAVSEKPDRKPPEPPC